jgi:hypothetical protein
MSYRLHSLAALLLLLAGAGCAAEAVGPEPLPAGDGEGSLQVAMQQQGADGALYHLRDARLRLTGQLDTLIEVGDSPVLQQTLPSGQYAMELLAGWWMQREKSGEQEEVGAELLGANPVEFSISSGQVTAVTLRFLVQGAGEIGFETGDMVVDMQVDIAGDGGEADDAGTAGDAGSDEAADAADPACPGALVINEVDYQQPGADDGEFVELYNPSDCPLSTEGLRLELVNGADGQALVYAGANLSRAGASIPAGGYLVVGSASVVEALPQEVPGAAISVPIQNGDPDGVRLLDSETVLDSLSYGGPVPGVTELETAPTDTGQGSIGRCPNGSDSDDNATDFAFTEVATPGAENHCGL